MLACYDELEHITDSIQKIFDVLDDWVYSYEIVFVDDNSRDNTRDLIAQIIAANPDRPLRTVFHDENTGRGGAVSDGMRAARGRVVGFIDIDLEVQPHYIPSCVRPILRGEADVVVGHRFYEAVTWLHIFRAFLSRGYQLIVHRFLNHNLGDSESGYKFFSRAALLDILPRVHDQHWFWDTEIITYAKRAGYRVAEVAVLFRRRADKTSTVKPIKDSIYYLRHLLRFKRRLSAEEQAEAAAQTENQPSG